MAIFTQIVILSLDFYHSYSERSEESGNNNSITASPVFQLRASPLGEMLGEGESISSAAEISSPKSNPKQRESVYTNA